MPSELLLLGVNHRSAPLQLREAMALSPEDQAAVLARLGQEPGLREAFVLSTCNRSELYAVADDALAGERAVRAAVERLKGLDLLAPGPHRYLHHNGDAARHLFRVAAGLDSLLLGEVQILGQVKDALALANEQRAAGPYLARLLATAVHAGKRARAETEIGAGVVSVASAAVALAAKVFGDLRHCNVLVAGAGETGRLAAQHFAERKPAALLIANRSLERARAVAAEVRGEAASLEEIAPALARADVVVCATRAPEPIVGYEAVRAAMKARASRPLVFVDIAVPRNVDPAVAQLDNVFLYPIDALRTLVDQNLARRERAVARVEAILEEELQEFSAWTRALDVTPTLRALREHFETLRAEEVQRHLGRFSEADAGRVEALTRALVNKLLHAPTLRLKEVDAASLEGSRRIETLREIFGLEAAAPAKDDEKRA